MAGTHGDLAFRAAVAFAPFIFVAPTIAAPCPKADFHIVLDVGHTPDDSGAISARGRSELEFNLQLSQLLEQHLRTAGFQNVFRFAAPPGTSMAARVAAENAQRPDLLISIHHDSVQRVFLKRWPFGNADHFYSDHARGWSLLVSQANTEASESLRFARLVADRLLQKGLPFSKHHSEPIRGENRAFVDAARGIYRYDHLAVLENSRAPAALLEAGVIVNPNEEAELTSPSRQEMTASALVAAVEAFCGKPQ
jgi:N-acetylmuramoyl-L-alanine amidase